MVGGLPRHYILSGRRRDSEKYKYLGSLTCASFCDDKSHCKDLFIMKNTVFPDIGNMLYWVMTLGKCIRKINVHMECFTCFISSEMFENGENISQTIFCRLFMEMFEKRYHSEFSGINHSTVYHKWKREKYNYEPYSYPIYRIYHCPIY